MCSPMRRVSFLFLPSGFLILALTLLACSEERKQPVPSATAAPIAAPASTKPAAQAVTPPASSPTNAAEEALPPLQYESELPSSVRASLYEPFTGDVDAMVKRRPVRVGVTYNRTHYFVDRGQQRGATYEYLQLFEERLNTILKTGNPRIHVVFIPMPRSMMLTALSDGRIDLAEGQLTITPERQALVDFGTPYRRHVNEIVVTAPGTPPVNVAEDLSGREVFVRKSSSYYQSLLALNTRLESNGRPPAVLVDAPESLEDDDLLEMVNANLVPIIVVDDYLARFWQQVFPRVRLHNQAVLRSGGDLALAFRKNSPLLADALAAFIKRWGPGSAFGNVIRARYLQSTRFAKSATAEAERRKFEALLALFRSYGKQYDLDYLLMAAQGYQESQLDQTAKSQVGAVGVMQVMPATGAELNVGDIHQVEPNIHAGVKYIRHLISNYFEDKPMDPINRMLFAFASYNAGPGRIRQLRRESARSSRGGSSECASSAMSHSPLLSTDRYTMEFCTRSPPSLLFGAEIRTEVIDSS
jgi:membrane-bound lytic murein transglycosylase MltF